MVWIARGGGGGGGGLLPSANCVNLYQRRHFTLVALSIVSVLLITQDTGISVRKRVIKILRDICLEQPDFHKITEMCVKMIRRVNDEEGIKVCVHSLLPNVPLCFCFFTHINKTWFVCFSHRNWWMRHFRNCGLRRHPATTKTPWPERFWTSQTWYVFVQLMKTAAESDMRKVWLRLTCSVMCPPTPQVSACRDSGYDWFEQLLQNVSILMNDKWQQCSFSHVCFLTSVCVDCCSCWSRRRTPPTNLLKRPAFSWWTTWWSTYWNMKSP